ASFPLVGIVIGSSIGSKFLNVSSRISGEASYRLSSGGRLILVVSISNVLSSTLSPERLKETTRSDGSNVLKARYGPDRVMRVFSGTDSFKTTCASCRLRYSMGTEKVR